MPSEAVFTFTIDFARGEGDPRRVFDAASLLIDGFEELDRTVAASIDTDLRTSTVLDDLQPGSLRVFLKTILQEVDDQALRDGEWKKAISPVLVLAKRKAVEALDRPEDHAKTAIQNLRDDIQRDVQLASPPNSLPTYGPIHEGRLVASLDKIQDGKRTLGTNDKLTIQTDDGKNYEVDLTRTWEPTEQISISNTTQTHSEADVVLTIRKPDLLGSAKWQFSYATAIINAPILDEKWLVRFHGGKIPLHSGDALACTVRFTSAIDDQGSIVEQRAEILKVKRVIRGPGHQTSMFDD